MEAKRATYPPVQDQEVCHLRVVPLRLSTPVHWEPEVAWSLPQRLLYVVYGPLTEFSHWPQKSARF